jgi:glucose/arabinose dehydrogenase
MPMPPRLSLRRAALGLFAVGLALPAPLLTPLLALAPIPALAEDWRDDAPGRLHHFEADRLPSPGQAGARASRPPAIVPCPVGFHPALPPGFTAERVLAGLDQPRRFVRAPDGTLFLAESGAGRLLAFRPDDPSPRVFAQGLDAPYGIAFLPPAAPRFLYVGEEGAVRRFPYRPGQPTALGPPEMVLALPRGGHWTRDLAASPEGRTLYVAVGSASNLGLGLPAAPEGGIAAFERRFGRGALWGEETGRAMVLALSLGDDLRLQNVHPFATGLRNCSALAIAPGSGIPWCAVNERDMLGDDLPPDYVTALRPGGFYGWPWFYTGLHPDPHYPKARPDLASAVITPDILLAPHSAPLGLLFSQNAALPPPWRGALFVALHGSWNRSRRTGYKVIAIPRRADGSFANAYFDFLTGFVRDEAHVCGRPVGLAEDARGDLWLSEDGNSTLWRIRWEGGATPRPPLSPPQGAPTETGSGR